MGALAFWGFGVSIYGKAKTTLRDAKETYTALDRRLSETTTALNDVKNYCAQPLIPTVPELSPPVE